MEAWMLPARYSYPSARSCSVWMWGAPVMIFSASAIASASGCVSTLVSRWQRRDQLPARQVVQRHHGLVGPHVPGVRDPPLARLAPVGVVVERRSGDDDPVLDRDDRVLERPDALGGVAVHGD